MQTSSEVTIKADIKKVWRIMFEEFERSQDWLSLVPKSEVMKGKAADGANVAGRICYLQNDADKLIADEKITKADPDNYYFEFVATTRNAPKAMPVKSNNVKIQLTEVQKGETHVSWISEPNVTALGKVGAPALKKGIKKGFDQLLDDLKVYAETDQVSDKKRKSNEKYGIK